MTSFVHANDPTVHLGVQRVERAAQAARELQVGAKDMRGAASVLLAAGVAALVVVANQFVDAWSDGHMLAGWMLLWVVAFASLALLARPARRGAHRMPAAGARADSQLPLWHSELRRSYIDGDLSRAVNGIAVEDIRRYRHWPDTAGRF